MSIHQKTADQLQTILEMWVVTYDRHDEKYLAETTAYVILDSEQLEWIHKMGLTVFSIQKFDEKLIVRFSSGGGY
ncbi:MAG: hypothetical protein O6761_06290 [Thaumarchaeota archaeon]|nr:hypothetical protein [Nitrososphaerota archaeon]